MTGSVRWITGIGFLDLTEGNMVLTEGKMVLNEV